MFRERKEEREIVNVALEIEEKTKPNQTLDFFRATKGNFVLFCFFFFSAHLCVKDSNFCSESGLRFVFFFFFIGSRLLFGLCNSEFQCSFVYA